MRRCAKLSPGVLRSCSWEAPVPVAQWECAAADRYAADLAEGAAEGTIGDSVHFGLFADVTGLTGRFSEALAQPLDRVLAIFVGASGGAGGGDGEFDGLGYGLGR